MHFINLSFDAGGVDSIQLLKEIFHSQNWTFSGVSKGKGEKTQMFSQVKEGG